MRLESEWRQLVTDIRNGYISESLQIDAEIRRKLNSQLSPDPERADELEVHNSVCVSVVFYYSDGYVPNKDLCVMACPYGGDYFPLRTHSS